MSETTVTATPFTSVARDDDGYSALLAADFFGSGYKSMVYAANGEIRWVPNTGSGPDDFGSSFPVMTLPVETNFENRVKLMFAVDVDLDGDLDIVVVHEAIGVRWANNTVIDTSGVFSPAGTIHSFFSEDSPVAQMADANNDGRPDMLLSYGSIIKVLTHPGAELVNELGIFWPETVLTPVASARTAALVDWDKDGVLDVLYAADGHGIRWFRATSPGVYVGSSTSLLTVVQQVAVSHVADINADGSDDLLYATTGSILSLTSGGPASASQLASVFYVYQMETGSVSGDGDLVDIIVSTTTSVGFVPALAPGVYGTFVEIGRPASSGGPIVFAAYAFDFVTGPGISFVAATMANSTDNLAMYLREDSGSFTVPVVRDSTPRACLTVVVADFDGDLSADIALGCTDGFVLWYPNTDMSGQFYARQIVTSSLVTAAIAATDIDHDGDRDLVLLSFDSLYVSINSNGAGMFLAPSAAFNDVGMGVHMEMEDVNGDGAIDAVVLDGSSDKIYIYWGTTAAPYFTARTEVPLPASSVSMFGLGDMSGDGRVDLAFSHVNGLTYLPGVATSPYFSAGSAVANLSTGGYLGNQLVIADFDGDGYGDLAVAARNYRARVFTNPGATPSPAPWGGPNLSTGTDSSSVAVADFDGDGDLDAITIIDETETAIDWARTSLGGSISITNINSGPSPAPAGAFRVAVGDFDGDLDMDAVVLYSAASQLGTFGTATHLRRNGYTLGVPKRRNLDLSKSECKVQGNTSLACGTGRL